jgi:putative acetyltransferase
MLAIRPEAAEDFAAVRQVNETAFGRPGEAALVEALRLAVRPYISLVALHDWRIVGHIFFSPVSVESEHASFTAIGLAPVAVLPEFQRQGIGSALVRAGLAECKRMRHDIVVVLGHSEYYPRFGFCTAKTKGLRCEYDVPEEVFMVAELSPGALNGRHGLVKYRPEFGNV